MTFTFKKATRQAVKLKIGMQGPSGSGKTLGALALAKALAPAGKVAVIDTENGSASLYGDRYEFDTLSLGAPYTSARYADAIDAAVEAGYEVIILDSISHQWMGEGGILSRKEALDARPGSNSYTNWASFTKEHETFKAKLLNCPAHLIATVRAKQDYVIEQNERGKSTPRKVGMAPVQRDGMEYEFSIVFELQMDHRAAVSKDRTGLFNDGTPIDLTDRKVGARINDWLSTGAAQTVAIVDGVKAAVATAMASGLPTKLPGAPKQLRGYGGQVIADVPTPALQSILQDLRTLEDEPRKKFEPVIEAIGDVLAERAAADEAVAV